MLNTDSKTALTLPASTPQQRKSHHLPRDVRPEVGFELGVFEQPLGLGLELFRSVVHCRQVERDLEDLANGRLGDNQGQRKELKDILEKLKRTDRKSVV